MGVGAGSMHYHKFSYNGGLGKGVLCRDMDEPGEHHSQQTDTRTENEIPHILTHRRVMNNEDTWTQGREHHTLRSVGGGAGEEQRDWGG